MLLRLWGKGRARWGAVFLGVDEDLRVLHEMLDRESVDRGR